MELKHYEFFQELLCNDSERAMSKYDIHGLLILKQQIYIDVFPIDSWNEWHYKIAMPDCSAPITDQYSSFNDNKDGFETYGHALEVALVRVYNFLNNIGNA